MEIKESGIQHQVNKLLLVMDVHDTFSQGLIFMRKSNMSLAYNSPSFVTWYLENNVNFNYDVYCYDLFNYL